MCNSATAKLFTTLMSVSSFAAKTSNFNGTVEPPLTVFQTPPISTGW